MNLKTYIRPGEVIRFMNKLYANNPFSLVTEISDWGHYILLDVSNDSTYQSELDYSIQRGEVVRGARRDYLEFLLNSNAKKKKIEKLFGLGSYTLSLFGDDISIKKEEGSYTLSMVLEHPEVFPVVMDMALFIYFGKNTFQKVDYEAGTGKLLVEVDNASWTDSKKE